MARTELNAGAVRAALEQRRAQRADRRATPPLRGSSFRVFIEGAWPVIEPATVFVPGWHIDAICEHLQAASRGEIDRLADQRPAATHEVDHRLGVVAGLVLDVRAAHSAS